jgi:hypothetical protein
MTSKSGNRNRKLILSVSFPAGKKKMNTSNEVPRALEIGINTSLEVIIDVLGEASDERLH